jgi:hypothetical protein
MILAEQEQTTPREIVPSGNHIARCYSMIELGTVTSEYMGEEKSLKKVRVSWELPFKKKVFDSDKGEQPFSVHKEYTLSMYEKANLRKDLESWRGQGFTEEQAKSFDISKLIGKPCMLNVIHRDSKKGNKYAVISSITPIPDGMNCPDQINATFELSYSEWSDAKFQSLPEWIRKEMEGTPEFQSVISGGGEVKQDVTSSDDLPF